MNDILALSHEAKPRASFYEGGKIGLATNDFINAADEFEATASAERDIMRSRARWLHENNPIIANIDRVICANVIGAGLKFQFKLGDETSGADKLNTEIELAWEAAKYSLDLRQSMHFDEMCAIALQNRFMDGECLFYIAMLNNELKIQPIEVDRFALGSFEGKFGGYYDGIRVDNFGRVISYHLNQDSFSNINIAGKKSAQSFKSDITLNAKDVIYYFKRENRFSQLRGISEYKQTIIDLKNFASFIRATIEAAKGRANIAYILKKQNPNIAKDLQKNPIVAINGIFVQNLGANESLEVLDPKVADDNFADFTQFVMRSIAAGRSVSYELASRDFSKVNYSGGRMSLLQDYKLFDDDLEHFSRNFYKPIFMRWLELECLKGRFSHLGLSYERFLSLKERILAGAISLYSPKREWVDPLKESKAIATELEYNTTTLQEIYARRGLDWQEQINQRAKEKQVLESLGLSMFNNADRLIDISEKESDE